MRSLTKKLAYFGCSTKWASKSGSNDWAKKKWAAQPVSLEKVDAAAVKALAENKADKLRMINVWATWWQAYVSEFKGLVDLNKIFNNRGFELITVSVDDAENLGKVLKFLEKEACSLPEAIQQTLVNEKRTTNNYQYKSSDKDVLADALDAKWRGGYPHTVLIAPEGEVLYRQTGEIDVLELRKAIVKFLGRTYAGRQWGN